MIIEPERLKRLLNRMIDIYSPSGKEEEILEYLFGYLSRHGLPVKKQKVDDSRYNLIILPESDIQLGLIGHLDTVIAYDLDSYGYQQSNDLITGLGSSDMKSGCASMIESFITLWKLNGFLPPVALVLVVGEEEEGDGAKALIESGVQFPWAIIGEPTDLKACLSSYGYLEVQLEANGRRKHASLADHGGNPIESVLKLIMEIVHYVENKRPELIYNIRDLYTSNAGFFVPDHCESWIDIHMPPESPTGEIVTELEELLGTSHKKGAQTDISMRFLTIDTGYELPEKGVLVDKIKEMFKRHTIPWEPLPFRSHSDANRLWASGVRPVILGPGELEKAHSPDESVFWGRVLKASELYLDLARSLI